MKYILFSILTIFSVFSFGQQAPVFDWVRQIKGPLFENIEDIALDDSGYVYTTGYFRGTADFNPASTPAVYTPESIGTFIQKTAPTGELVWVKVITGVSNTFAYAMDVNDQGIVIVGRYSGTVDFDPGPSVVEHTGFQGFVLKLDLNGNFQWVKTISLGSSSLSQVKLDGAGNIYYVGDFSGTPDFDPGAGVSNLSSVGNTSDIFLSLIHI